MANTKLSALTELTAVDSGTTLYGINTAVSSFKIPVKYLDLYITGRNWGSGRFSDIKDLQGTIRLDISDTGVTFITNSGKQVFVASGATHTSIRDSNSIPRFVISGTTSAMLDANQYARVLIGPNAATVKDQSNRNRISIDASNLYLLDANGYQRFEAGSSNSILRNWNNKNIIFGNSASTTFNNPSGGTSILAASGYTNIYSSGDGKLRFTASGDTLKLLDVSGRDRLLVNSVGTYLYDNLGTTRMSYGNGYNYIYNKAGGLILDTNTSNTTLRHNTGSLNNGFYFQLTNSSFYLKNGSNQTRFYIDNNLNELGIVDTNGYNVLNVLPTVVSLSNMGKYMIASNDDTVSLGDPNNRERIGYDLNILYINDTGANNRFIIDDTTTNGILIKDKNAVTRMSILNSSDIKLSNYNGVVTFFSNPTITALMASNSAITLADSQFVYSDGSTDRFSITPTEISFIDSAFTTRLSITDTQTRLNYGANLGGARAIQFNDTDFGLYDTNGNNRLFIDTNNIKLYDSLPTERINLTASSFNLNDSLGGQVIESTNTILNLYRNSSPVIYANTYSTAIHDQDGIQILTAASGYAIIASGTRPATRTAAGNYGAITFDAGFLYVCTGKGTDKWGRATIASF